MTGSFYYGTTKHKPAEPDYYLDIYSCTDAAIDRVIEARRAEFIDEWYEYESRFFD